MIRTVQTVDGKTPAEFCSPPMAASPPTVDSNPSLVFDTCAAIYSEDGNSLVGVIDFFCEARRYKGPTIEESARQGPYPGVYTDVVDDDGGGLLDVVDADTRAAWGIDTDPDTTSPGPAPADLLSEEEVERRRRLADERDSKWEEPEAVHENQAGLDAAWGEDDGDGDDVVPQRDPCSYAEIRSCTCCRCPDCHAQSIRARKNKEPRFACGNPSCDTEGFKEPVRIVETITSD